MIRCTMADPLEPSITSVSFMAASPSSTAVLASLYRAPSTTLAHFTRFSRSGAQKFHLAPRHVGNKNGEGLVARMLEFFLGTGYKSCTCFIRDVARDKCRT